jgi:Mg-chelatase subunit ChlD
MKRVFARVTWPLLFLAIGWNAIAAQERTLLRVTRLDTSDFPLVRVNLITADSRGAPLTDLSALSLRENGIPIGDLEVTSVAIGVDVIFVIDANTSFAEVDDDSDLTRSGKVQASITRFVTQFMTERDRVTMVVPSADGAGGEFLLEDAAAASAVVDAIGQYSPESLSRTPLQEMLMLALAHAADGKSDGHYQSILLFTDGAQLSQQLNYPVLDAQIQAVEIPVFAALLGARADPPEIDNVTRLSEPSNATYVHMPDAAETDAIYSIWRRQGSQVQIGYRSLQSSSGRYPVTVNLGSARALGELALVLTPPELTFAIEDLVIRRVGDASDAPLEMLEPMTLAIPVGIDWPHEQPRRLVAANLFVDGQMQQVPASLNLDDNNVLLFDWNIAGLDEGNYSLVVQATDELGFSVVSEPFPIAIEVERPLPPTPTLVPTSVPETSPVAPERPVNRDRLLVALAASGLLALVLLRFRGRQISSEVDVVVEPVQLTPETYESAQRSVEAVPHIAFLEMVDAAPGHVARIRIEGESVTIGRDHNAAQIVFDDQSVAQLHARIKMRDGQYWLYDEGSADGTFHNYERLGLSPRPIEDQDMIRFGRVQLRFHLRQVEEQS